MKVKVVLILFVIIMGSPIRADAYIDPTAGGLLIQLLLGGLAGLGVIAKLYWGKIQKVFRWKAKK